MFGRATIGLGIGPHSSFIFVLWFLIFMAALRSRCGHYILPYGFFLSSSSFSSPNLSGCRADVYHTWCGFSANLERRSEMCCTRLAGNTGHKMTQKSPSGHHRTTLSG